MKKTVSKSAQSQFGLGGYRELVNYRIRKGWTLRDLSRLSGISPATLSRLERGTQVPSTRSKVLLQSALGETFETIEHLLRPIKRIGETEAVSMPLAMKQHA